MLIFKVQITEQIREERPRYRVESPERVHERVVSRSPPRQQQQQTQQVNNVKIVEETVRETFKSETREELHECEETTVHVEENIYRPRSITPEPLPTLPLSPPVESEPTFITQKEDFYRHQTITPQPLPTLPLSPPVETEPEYIRPVSTSSEYNAKLDEINSFNKSQFEQFEQYSNEQFEQYSSEQFAKFCSDSFSGSIANELDIKDQPANFEFNTETLVIND